VKVCFQKLPRITFLIALVIGLTSCSKEDGSIILGHWRAERLKWLSLNLPIWPEFVITKNELFLLTTDIHIPIDSLSEKGNEVIVNTSAGLGFSFYFEGSDRMYADVPLAGRIYYQRARDTQQLLKVSTVSSPMVNSPAVSPAVTATTNGQPEQSIELGVPTPVTTISAIASSGALNLVHQAERKIEADGLTEAQVLLLEAKSIDGENPIVDYNLAVLRVRQFNNEAAIRHLNDAFRNGFRALSLLDSNPDLVPLKSDVRYQALVSRYK
jgi:hypothetical protein